MTKELAELLMEAADNLGVEASLREGYSGRGMMGRPTHGVVFGTWPEALCVAFEAGCISAEREMDVHMSGEVARSDAMGRSLILY